ncbi:hypothetical protein ACFQ2B_07400 [Streptomyces stramineus]|uniref:hypothetical protein n=1 Tax=Streptomyces TaxID=1883 RepID=UPI0031E0DF00
MSMPLMIRSDAVGDGSRGGPAMSGGGGTAGGPGRSRVCGPPYPFGRGGRPPAGADRPADSGGSVPAGPSVPFAARCGDFLGGVFGGVLGAVLGAVRGPGFVPDRAVGFAVSLMRSDSARTTAEAEMNRSSRLSSSTAEPVSGSFLSYNSPHQASSWPERWSPC